MVKIDAEAFKNKFEKYLSEMMCSQSLKHKDVLPEFSGLYWAFFFMIYMLYCCSLSYKGFMPQIDFFLFPYFCLNSSLFLVL